MAGMGKTAALRWAKMRNAAGFNSDRALERAAGISAGTIWTWITPGKAGRDPNVRTLRILKHLMQVTLDDLDQTLVAWREELSEAACVSAETGDGQLVGRETA